ncbi:MAG: hypothetical protein ACPG7D_09230, partial [Candidatus Puniceispirillaceae bacterium]
LLSNINPSIAVIAAVIANEIMCTHNVPIFNKIIPNHRLAGGSNPSRGAIFLPKYLLPCADKFHRLSI